jgi:hypothetical protein
LSQWSIKDIESRKEKDETQEELEDRMASCEAADRRQRYRKKASKIN